MQPKLAQPPLKLGSAAEELKHRPEQQKTAKFLSKSFNSAGRATEALGLTPIELCGSGTLLLHHACAPATIIKVL